MYNARLMSDYVEARIQATRSDRGDVPGWVMITLMTAAIVAVIWTTASEWLTSLFSDAQSEISSVNK